MRAVLVLLIAALGLPAAAEPLVISGVNVVPMDRETVLKDQTVVIRAGRIERLGPAAEFDIPSEATVIDGRGRYLIPGLIDAHVHLEAPLGARADFGDGPIFLRYGITSVVNLRGFPEHLELKRRIEDGELIAPRLFTSGEFVNEPRVQTPQAATREVRAQAEAGYDLIKFREVIGEDWEILTTTGLDAATFTALNRAAREAGVPILGHAPSGLDLEDVIANDFTIAHAGELVRFHFRPFEAPFGLWVVLGGLGVLLVVVVACVLGLPFAAGRVGRRGLAWIALAAAGALALGMAGLAAGITLLPGGRFYGQMPAGIVMVVLFAGVGLAGGWQAIRWLDRERFAGAVARALAGVSALAMLAVAVTALAYAPEHISRAAPGQVAVVAERLATSNAFLGTTLILYDEMTGLVHTGRRRIDPGILDRMSPEFRDRHERVQAFFSDPGRRRWTDLDALAIHVLAPRYHDFTRELAGALHRAGVPLLAGTDAYGFALIPPGPSLHAELQILIEAGLTPFEALQSATVNPARFLGRAGQLGVIAEGAAADLVLLEADPLAGLEALGEIAGVVAAGRWFSAETLDASGDIAFLSHSSGR